MSVYLHNLKARRADLVAERDEHLAALETIATASEARGGTFTPAERAEITDRKRAIADLKRQLDGDTDTEGIDARIAELEQQIGQAGLVAKAHPRTRRRPGSETATPDEERACRTIDDAFNSGRLPAYAAERASNLVIAGNPSDRPLAARWVNAAGNPDYRAAFAKLAADPVRGHLLWTPAEADAYRAVAAVQAELEGRAMSLTAAAGGYVVPLTLDPAIMLSNDGNINPLRQLATIKQTTTNAWQGVTSAGVTAEWKTEGAQVADAAPTIAAPSIPVFFGDAFVPYSFEVGMDADSFLDELTLALADGASNLMATAYTTGNGTTAPQGIVTGLAGTSSEINTTGTETYDDSDPFVLQNALPARFSADAVFMSHIATANAYRQMETTNGALQFPELRQTPPMLLGKPWHENSNMDGTINPAATASNYVMVYGDIKRGFFIVDRIGTTLEFIPNIVGANQRPTGQRGALLWFRTGSEVVIPEAMRLLDVPTTA